MSGKKPRATRVRTGNPPGLLARVLFPRGKGRETGCKPRVGGLPKSTQFWHGGDLHGEFAGIPLGIWAAKVGLRDIQPYSRKPVRSGI